MIYRNDRAPRVRTGQGMPLREALRLLDIQAFPKSVQRLVSSCSSWDLLRLIRRIDPRTAAAVFECASPDEQRLLVAHLSAERLHQLMQHLSVPVQNRVLDELPTRRRQRVLSGTERGRVRSSLAS